MAGRKSPSPLGSKRLIGDPRPSRSQSWLAHLSGPVPREIPGSVSKAWMMEVQMNAKGDLKASEFSIAEARRSFPTLIREAENGRAARTTRRGKPVALLIGHRQLERIGSDRRNFVEEYEEFSKSYDLEDLQSDPDEVFRDSREESAGRDVPL